MSNNVSNKELSNEQIQELLDAITDKCEQMELVPVQILDGISKCLLGATMALGTRELSVNVEGAGKVNVVIFD